MIHQFNVHYAPDITKIGLNHYHMDKNEVWSRFAYCASEEYLAKFFQGPKLQINEEELSKSRSELSHLTWLRLFHIQILFRPRFAFKHFISSPTVLEHVNKSKKWA